jgi:uncharacterized protein
VGLQLELKIIQLNPPSDTNAILGQSHFIKTVEDLHETIVSSVPGAKFGLAFCEASGPCLVRSSGNDDELRRSAEEHALRVGAGHTFLILLKNAYPINILPRIKEVPEICSIYAASANPLQVLVAETDQGRAIIGVVDGFASKGVEAEKDVQDRKQFLRKTGYKL